jgi:hypothetical protein
VGIKCFWLAPTGHEARWLRRYVSFDVPEAERKCAVAEDGYHQALVRIEDGPCKYVESEGERYHAAVDIDAFLHDSRWPVACACGRPFTDDDNRQVFTDTIYKRTDTGASMPLRDAPPGAMWDAWWLKRIAEGPDGRCLIVKLPNGNDWTIDGQASNCTMPDDHQQKLHHCWVRHGEPPNITVDKNGVTCAAGAGSILSGDYHGFLVNGEFNP